MLSKILGAHKLGQAFHALTRVERWARLSSGIVFILVGLYFVATRIVGLGV